MGALCGCGPHRYPSPQESTHNEVEYGNEAPRAFSRRGMIFHEEARTELERGACPGDVYSEEQLELRGGTHCGEGEGPMAH